MGFTQGHALLIGVESYLNVPELNLPNTAADACELAAILRDSRYGSYSEAQISFIDDTSATRTNILAALSKLAASTTEDDTVLLFYSGHGHYGADGAYYLTTSDTRLTNERKVIAGSAINHQELLNALQALSARRVLLIFNACHAGALVPTLDIEAPFIGNSLPDQLATALLATGEGRVIITACREHQYSFVGHGNHTIFAEALVNGLRGAAGGQRGYISVFDLYTYLYFTVVEAVKQQVPAALRQRYGETQEPELTILKGVGPFAVAQYAGATQAGESSMPISSISGTVVREIEPDQSRALLQQILSGGMNFGQHTSTIDHSSIVVGNQQNVNDNRIGVSISGGTVQGAVVGFNAGTLNISASVRTGTGAPDDALEQALAIIQQMVAQAEQRGDEDLTLDLQAIVLSLQAALKARREGKTERQLTKVREARAAIEPYAAAQPALQAVVRMLQSQGT
jgi:hypothetical protein